VGMQDAKLLSALPGSCSVVLPKHANDCQQEACVVLPYTFTVLRCLPGDRLLRPWGYSSAWQKQDMVLRACADRVLLLMETAVLLSCWCAASARMNLWIVLLYILFTCRVVRNSVMTCRQIRATHRSTQTRCVSCVPWQQSFHPQRCLSWEINATIRITKTQPGPWRWRFITT